MTEETNVTEQTENKCFCKSEEFKKFEIITAGTFTGVFLALTLFAALHKPPMIHHVPYGAQFRPMGGCPCHVMHHNRHHMGGMKQRDNGDFQKQGPKFDKKFNGDKRGPFEEQKRIDND